MDKSASVFLELTTEAIAEELYQLAHELDRVKFSFFLCVALVLSLTLFASPLALLLIRLLPINVQ